MFKPPWIRDSCFVTPFQKGVEYSQVSLYDNNTVTHEIYIYMTSDPGPLCSVLIYEGT